VWGPAGHERAANAPELRMFPGIVGLAKAAELAMHSLEDGTIGRLAKIARSAGSRPSCRIAGDWCEWRTYSGCPRSGIFGPWGIDETPSPRVANTTNIWFDHVEGEALVIAMDLRAWLSAGGSACHSGATEPSHVLMAMGLDRLAHAPVCASACSRP